MSRGGAGADQAPPAGSRTLTGLLVLGEAAVLLLVGVVPGAAATPWPALGLWAAAFLLYAAAAARHERSPLPRSAMWAGAIVLRIPFLFLAPHFSDDIWRYLWDGWVSIHGINPYAHPPSAPALDPITTTWRALVNHPGIRTIYPPGAQLAFAALAALGPSVLLFKAAWTAADLAVGWVLDRLTAGSSGPPALAPALWLWSPLVVVEVAWSGHLEPLGVLPVVAALLALAGAGRRGSRASAPGPRGLAAGLLFGAGAAVKFAPAAVLPALGRRRGLAAAALGLALPALLYLPYLGAGGAVFGGLAAYADRWRFDPGLFRILAWAVGDPHRARAVAAVLVAGVAGLATVRRWPVDRAAFWILGSALLLSPTIHPWYLLWVLPLAFLRRNRAWVLWSGLVFLGYAGLDAYQATGTWPLPGWLSLLIHGPFLLLLAADAALGHGQSSGGQVAGREQEPEGHASSSPGRQEPTRRDQQEGAEPQPHGRPHGTERDRVGTDGPVLRGPAEDPGRSPTQAPQHGSGDGRSETDPEAQGPEHTGRKRAGGHPPEVGGRPVEEDEG